MQLYASWFIVARLDIVNTYKKFENILAALLHFLVLQREYYNSRKFDFQIRFDHSRVHFD